MLLSSICKINIGLHILSKRSDGYHTLESVFVPCRWSDCIEIVESPSQNKDIELITSGLKIDSVPQNNSIYKVIQSLRKRYLLPNLYIHLHKQVPMGAGLGGGSSNAARVLQYLKRAYLSKLSDREALEILAQIGSDCRFFWQWFFGKTFFSIVFLTYFKTIYEFFYNIGHIYINIENNFSKYNIYNGK